MFQIKIDKNIFEYTGASKQGSERPPVFLEILSERILEEIFAQ